MGYPTASNKLFACAFGLLALATAKLQNDCGHRSLDGCVCGREYYERQVKFVVRCVDQRFSNVDMLKVLPQDTEVLIFTGNSIRTLPWNIFGDLNNLTRLRTIDMSNNGIRDIKGKSYHHVPNVELLILNHNELLISDTEDDNFHHPRVFSNFVNLQELHLTNAFADNSDDQLANDLHDIFVNSGLTKLFKLHLEQNEIRSFKDQNVFCDLPSLRDLYMGDNLLAALNFNLRCLKKLRFLDLENNNIARLTQRDLDVLDRMVPADKDNEFMIDISRNPLKCDPAVKVLYAWMQKTNVTVRNKDSLECYSNKFGQKYMLNVKFLSEQKSSRFSQATNVLLVLLSLILVSLISAYAYLSREAIKSKLLPIIDKVGRKVQYSTIDSQDV